MPFEFPEILSSNTKDPFDTSSTLAPHFLELKHNQMISIPKKKEWNELKCSHKIKNKLERYNYI